MHARAQRSLYQNAEFEMRFRDFPIVRAVCLGRTPLLDHFAHRLRED